MTTTGTKPKTGRGETPNTQGRGGRGGRGEYKPIISCWGCGRGGHSRDPRPTEGQLQGCIHAGRPFFNLENCPWRQSTEGKRYIALEIAKGNPSYTGTTLGTTWFPAMPIDSSVVKPKIIKPADQTQGPNKRHKGMHIPNLIPYILGSICSDPDNGFINGDLRVRDRLIRVDVLIDTGALQGNYISKTLADKWQVHSKELQDKVLIQIAAGKGVPILVTNFCETKITLLAIENVVSKKTLSLAFQILDGPYDIIIGRHSIIEHELWDFILDAPQVSLKQKISMLSGLLIDKSDVL